MKQKQQETEKEKKKKGKYLVGTTRYIFGPTVRTYIQERDTRQVRLAKERKKIKTREERWKDIYTSTNVPTTKNKYTTLVCMEAC